MMFTESKALERWGIELMEANQAAKIEDYLKQPGASLVFGMIQKFKGGEDSEEEEQIEAIDLS
jgi:type I restriction enzyme R subunit